MPEPTDGTTPEPTSGTTTMTGVAARGGTVTMDASTGDVSLQSEALRAICFGWLGMLAIYAGTIFVPLWQATLTDGAYDLISKALLVEEKLMIALTSSLMTAVTMSRGAK